jgi:hypothetical protein
VLSEGGVDGRQVEVEPGVNHLCLGDLQLEARSCSGDVRAGFPRHRRCLCASTWQAQSKVMLLTADISEDKTVPVATSDLDGAGAQGVICTQGPAAASRGLGQ